MRLGFTPEVLRHFAFLETECSFRCVDCSAQYVRWESPEVFVYLSYDCQRSYELYLGVGRMAVLVHGQEVPFGLDEISRFAGGSWGSWAVRACDQNELDQRLLEMSSVLKGGGKRFLLKDAEAFAQLETQRHRECAEYALTNSLRRMRESAEGAWKSHDFESVIHLYGEYWEHLTPSERKRYEIATKHLGKENVQEKGAS
jgi:hypothetical protein